MMMSSTFPTTKSNENIKLGLREIQKKKENLKLLESALKKKVIELKELCLKEGELTGQLPADYPLQPREPIPQVRRRTKALIAISSQQPYYEETKPFQMSDFYKYSSKFRSKSNDIPQPTFKTTRQLQDDVLKKNSIRFSSYDDQIQASVKLIEKSGQKLIEATAKAIAGNPALAEKLNNILPNNGEGYYF